MYKSHTIFGFYFFFIVSEDLLLKQTIQSVSQLPSLKKISINYSSKNIIQNSEFAIPILSGLQLICGQKLKITKAKKSISTFQTRKNQIIGCKLTLRKTYLYSFIDKLIFIILPYLYLLNNKQVSESSYNLGLQYTIAPEIEKNYDKFQYINGFNIQFSFSTKTKKDSKLLLTSLRLFI